MGLLDLPAVPADLRTVQPYLQRADELKAKEPIIAYWCAYYAAQVGIALKTKDPASRELLFALITKLEQMKLDAGPSDAIDQEAASSAYVEGFALKVFSAADNEDRRGESTRSTAKKFLAAANFLEVLKTFPSTELSDTNDDKIRYAKWKAADIAKAFREGRKPAPGPAGSQDLESTPQGIDIALPSPPNAGVDGSSFSIQEGVSPPKSQSRHRRGSSASPPKILPFGNSSPKTAFAPTTPPRKSGPAFLGVTGQWSGVGHDPNSPASWSTAATPGTTPHPTPGQQSEFVYQQQESPSKRSKRRKENGSDLSDGSDGSGGSGGSLKPSLKYQSNGNVNAEALGLGASKSVRWTESVEGGLSTAGGSPPATPGSDQLQYPSSFGSVLPPGFVPAAAPPPLPVHPVYPGGPPQPAGSSPSQIYANTPSPPQYIPPPVTNISPPQIYAPVQSAPSAPPILPSPQTHAPSVSPSTHTASASPQIYAAPKVPSPPQIYAQPSPQVDLTPATVLQIQKHCRFAISSLDYEDADEAKRQLRAALAILGG